MYVTKEMTTFCVSFAQIKTRKLLQHLVFGVCVFCVTSKQLLHCFPVFSNVDGSNDEKHSPHNPDHGAEQQAVLQTVKVPVGAPGVYGIRDLHRYRYEIGVSDQ